MPAEKYECPIGISDEYYRLIGIIAAQWERVDFLLEWAVAEIGSHDPVSVGLLSTNLTFTAKIELILTHAEPLRKPAPEKFREISNAIQEIRRVNSLRNMYVHARWMPADNDENIALRSVVRTTQGKLDIGNKPTPLSELVMAARDINNAGESFMKIMNDFGLLKGI